MILRWQREQPSYGVRQIMSDPHHAEPMTVEKLKVRKFVPEALPEAPGTEITLAHIDVVAEHDTSLAQLRPPRLEIVRHGFERVIPVDVEQVDAAVGEVDDGFIKRRSDQLGERRESAIVVGGPVLENRLVEETCVGVA